MSTETEENPRDLSEFMKDMDKVPIHFSPAGGPASPTPLTPQKPPDASGQPQNVPSQAPGATQENSEVEVASDAPLEARTTPESSPGAAADPSQVDWDAAPTPRTPADWKKFKAARKAQEDKLKGESQSHAAKVAELESKLKSFEDAPPVAAKEARPEDVAEIERLKKENAELHERFLETEILADPTVKQQFETRSKAVVSEINQVLGEAEAKEFMELWALPEGEYKKQSLAAFYAGLDDIQKSDLGVIRTKLRAIDSDRKHAVEYSGTYKAEKDAQRTKHQQQLVGEKRKVFDGVIKGFQDPKTGNPAFHTVADNPEWNARVQKQIDIAWDLLQGKPVGKPEDVAKVILWGVSTPTVLASVAAQMKTLQEKNTSLETQISSMKAAKPSAGSQGSAARPDASKMKVTSDMKPSDVTREFVRSVKAGFGGL